ncbi:hypothetical protein SCLCIDRAFT_1217788 [Scleroderma citrinum Foug A]|uniref:DUF7918 domain-containing protein n=1 Tax=Scleroderma citrinum Foug A TaxID=1036808 RepID=A0A0C2ZC67_9AGAM|nr:hypothetical protein SCLCIDRAFT_1217788 [Scleroderma citrinum Foug A]
MLGSLSARQGLFRPMYIPIPHIGCDSPLHTQHFSLTFGHTHKNDAFDIRIATDGLRCAKLLKSSESGTRRETVIGVPTSPTSVRPYMFSGLQLTDEDEYLNNESSHMGEVRLDFYRCVYLGRYTTKRYDVCEPKGKVHERAKKALSHCVSLGREVSRSATRCFKTKRLDANPLASFIFKYREHSGFIRVPRLRLRFLTSSTQVFSVPTG